MNKYTDFNFNKKYEEEANQHEKEIYVLLRGGVAEYANLSVLYWSFATELFEFVIPNNISETLQELGTRRFKSVLDDGLIKYPESVELNFWKRYYHHRMFFSDFNKEECLDIINKYQIKSLVPYFYLNILNEGHFQNEVQLLLAQCKEEHTAKNLYIMSFIERKNW